MKEIPIEERIDWIFKALDAAGSDVSERDAEWVIRLSDQWKRSRRLSERQIEVLEDIYKRYA